MISKHVRWIAAAAALSLALASCSMDGAHSGCSAAACGNDKSITTQIRDAIFSLPEVTGNDITVEVREGVVYLYGVLDTQVQRDAVEAIARKTDGVKSVIDSIELRGGVR